MSCATGDPQQGTNRWSGERKRISGMLIQGARNLILTTDKGDVWIIDAVDAVALLIGHQVKIEGVATGTDRLCADWIGASQRDNSESL